MAQAAWQEFASRSDLPDWVVTACRRFEDDFRSGKPARIEDYLTGQSEPLRSTLFLHLYQLHLRLRQESGGSSATQVDYVREFPEYAHLVVGELDAIGSIEVHSSTFAAAAGESVDEAEGHRRPPSLAPPQTLKGYQLQEYLGGGTFGEVWKALHPALNRVVAVKILRSEHAANEKIRNSFVEEGRKLGVLNGVGVVQVFDAGQEGDWHFLVSEFVEGGDLSKWMARKPPSPDDAARLVADVAQALHRAHALQIIHRDIKPQNILLDREGNPKLADFGLAATDVEQRRERGGVLGTAAYMAPELVRGESHWADSRTDVYALGVVLYQMLAGKVPFRGRNRDETYRQILERPPPPLRVANESISPVLESICLKCLAKKPEERYSTARDLERALRRCVGPRAVPWKWIGGGAAALLVMVAAVVILLNGKEPEDTRRQPAVGAVAPIAEEDDAFHQAWTSALGVAAARLSPPGEAHTADIHFSKEVEGLSVTTAAIALVELGTLDIGESPQFSFGVDITEPDLHGGTGIFLGYHEGPCSIQGQPAAGHMQAIWLAIDEKNEFRVRRWKAEIDPRTGSLLETEALGWKGVPYPSSTQPSRLQVDVAEGKVVRVWWDGELLDELVTEYADLKMDESYFNGEFGVFTKSGGAWFRNPQAVKSAGPAP